MGGKRKSQGGDSGKKNRRIEDCLEGAQALLSGAQKSVKTFNEWLSKPEYLLILAVLWILLWLHLQCFSEVQSYWETWQCQQLFEEQVLWWGLILLQLSSIFAMGACKCCYQASLLAYLRFVDTAFPPPADLSSSQSFFKHYFCNISTPIAAWFFWDSRQYVTPSHLNRRGGVLLRPWHLVWMSSAGFKGFCEPARGQVFMRIKF